MLRLKHTLNGYMTLFKKKNGGLKAELVEIPFYVVRWQSIKKRIWACIVEFMY